MLANNRTIIILLLLFTFGVLAILIITPSITQNQLKKYTNHSEYKDLIEVPNVLGKTIVEASEILRLNNLKVVELPVSPYNPNFPQGSIIRQDPFSGDLVKDGRTIYLTPNPNSVTQIMIPNYSDKSFRSVKNIFENSKLQVGKIFYKNNYAENVVLGLMYNGKKINNGDSVPIFSIIDMYLGAGKNNINEKIIRIPNLIGSSFVNYETGTKIQDLIKDNFLNVGAFYLDEANIKDTTDFFIYKQFPSADIDTNFMFISDGGMSPSIDLYFTRDSTKLVAIIDSINNINNN
mgnify:FL=1